MNDKLPTFPSELQSLLDALDLRLMEKMFANWVGAVQAGNFKVP